MRRILFYSSLILFISLLLFTRFWQLGKLPPGIHIDEVSFGYEAQSLLETGRDTWNKPWPLYFKGFGEYKAPGVIYTYYLLLKTPFFHHINTFITRLPAVISGLIIILIFAITLKLLFSSQLNRWQILLLSFAFAFSPWAFDLSRVYYESYAGLFFFPLGIYLLFKAFKQQSNRSWFLALVNFSLAGYYYASYRFIASFILFVAYWLYTDFKFKWKLAFFSLLTFSLVGFGWLIHLFDHQGLFRFQQFSGGSTFGSSLIVNEKRQFCYLSLHHNYHLSKICYLFWNKPIVISTLNLKTFLHSLYPDTLFSKLDSEYGSEGNYGAFLLPLLVFYFLAIIKMFSQKLDKYQWLILAVILFGFLPSFITKETNIHRNLVGLYGISLFLVYGFIYYQQLSQRLKPLLRYFLHSLFILSLLFFAVQFQLDYFLIANKSTSQKYPYRQDISDIYSYLRNSQFKYDQVYDLRNNISPLYAAFYGLLSAQEIHQTGHFTPPNKGGWSFLYSAGKFTSTSKSLKQLICDYHKNDSKANILLIVSPQPQYHQLALYQSKSFNQVHVLGELYSVQDLVNYHQQIHTNWNQFCRKYE